jgi:hypothetical protein
MPSAVRLIARKVRTIAARMRMALTRRRSRPPGGNASSMTI